jgi:hypothetical protein
MTLFKLLDSPEHSKSPKSKNQMINQMREMPLKLSEYK